MANDRGHHMRDTFAVLRAMRSGPLTIAQLAAETGAHWRKVYRIVESLGELGAPIKSAEDPTFEGRGRAPLRYSLSAAALREWIG